MPVLVRSAYGLLSAALVLFGAPVLGEPRAAPVSEWKFLGGNSDGWQFSALDKVNASNAGQLGLAWYADIPSLDGLVGNPQVAGGVVYQGGPLGRIYANDLRTGKSLWVFAPDLRFDDATSFVAYWASHFNRGLAVDDERVYIGAICDLIAVDRKTGAQIWRSHSCDQTEQNGITAAPVVGHGKVFIGHAGADVSNTRGFVDAFDASNGHHLWRFYTMPGDPSKPFENPTMAMAAKTWGTNYWQYTHGGLHVWDAVTFDDKLNQVYLGTDCAHPDHAKLRAPDAGDELFACAIVAVDADSGRYLWHVSTVPHNDQNLDAAARVVVADLPVDGHPTRVVLDAPKNGFFYVIDAKSGKVISAEHYVPVTWAARIDVATGRPVPIQRKPGEPWVQLPSGRGGAHAWHSMSFDPTHNLVYIPAIQVVDTFSSPDTPALEALKADYKSEGQLIAWDPIAQRERWHVDRKSPFNGGILTTAGNLVFQGTGDGYFQTFAADTGKLLWSFDARSVILGAPTTVEVDGEELILVPVGNGGSSVARQATFLYGDRNTFAPSRLLAFKLGGKADFPKFTPIPMPKPVRPPQPAETAARGARLYNEKRCSYCHNRDAIGSGPGIPDLRMMSEGTHRILADLVIKGLNQPFGMPAFRDLSPGDLDSIRAYVINQAWDEYNREQADSRK